MRIRPIARDDLDGLQALAQQAGVAAGRLDGLDDFANDDPAPANHGAQLLADGEVAGDVLGVQVDDRLVRAAGDFTLTVSGDLQDHCAFDEGHVIARFRGELSAQEASAFEPDAGGFAVSANGASDNRGHGADLLNVYVYYSSLKDYLLQPK
jgi:hypothetical protein